MEQIEQVAIETLIPYKNNARLHSDKQIGQIAESIKSFGFNNPVLIDSKEQHCWSWSCTSRKTTQDENSSNNKDKHLTEEQKKRSS